MARTSARHTAQEQFEATGERVQVWARDTRLLADAPLARLERGMAAAWRPDARAGHLVCPIPGCEDPRLTTRAGSRRDHFAHRNLVGAPHVPETWFHYTGKHLVGAWARRLYPEARVAVDEAAVENRQVPDVLVEFPDGLRFAFEVQYAALTEDDWRARHDGYAAQGIADVWLLGHLPRYLRPARGPFAFGRYAWTPVAEAMEEAGVPVRWVNPDERSVATRALHADPHAYYREPYTQRGELARPEALSILVDPLDDCRIDGRRFTTPADAREREAAERWLERERARIADANARIEREAVQRAAERERQQATEAERARRRAWVERQRQERADDYERRVRPRVLAELAGAAHVIEVEAKSDEQIWMHPATWHAELFRNCIEGRVGSTFTVPHAVAPFMASGQRGGPPAAVRAYLAFLARRGYLDFHSTGGWIEGDITVLADSRHPPAGHEDDDWRMGGRPDLPPGQEGTQ